MSDLFGSEIKYRLDFPLNQGANQFIQNPLINKGAGSQNSLK